MRRRPRHDTPLRTRSDAQATNTLARNTTHAQRSKPQLCRYMALPIPVRLYDIHTRHVHTKSMVGRKPGTNPAILQSRTPSPRRSPRILRTLDMRKNHRHAIGITIDVGHPATTRLAVHRRDHPPAKPARRTHQYPRKLPSLLEIPHAPHIGRTTKQKKFQSDDKTKNPLFQPITLHPNLPSKERKHYTQTTHFQTKRSLSPSPLLRGAGGVSRPSIATSNQKQPHKTKIIKEKKQHSNLPSREGWGVCHVRA